MSKRKPLIAVVDDDISVCRALKRLIRSLGMNAETFTSGQEFLDLIESIPSFAADCVILDIQMPGLNGLEVQERLARERKSMPVIFITAHEEIGARERALEAGAIAFLRKPFSDELLIKTLNAAFGQIGEDTGEDEIKPKSDEHSNGGGAMKRKLIIVLTLILHAGVVSADVYIYPTKGQSQQQQSKDRYECHTWAVQQTGFDPSRAQAALPPSSPQPGGEIVKGAARGALPGTAGGAIAGDAGRGAAAGAATTERLATLRGTRNIK